jgi:membrane protein implicated in regulation of membrane protease activity
MTITTLHNKLFMTGVATTTSLVTNTILALMIVVTLATVMVVHKMRNSHQESSEDIMSKSLAKGLAGKRERKLEMLSTRKIQIHIVSNDNESKASGAARA